MKIQVTAENTLTEILIHEFPDASRTRVKSMVSHGNVSVNGKVVTNPSVIILPEDEVEYSRQKREPSKKNPPFPIVYEDEDILVAVKPAGLLTVGDRGVGGTSFYKILLEFMKERSRGKERIFVVHRLDREVSGLLVFAKSEAVQQILKEHWPQSKKRYYALVEGRPTESQGTIQSWLKEGKDQKVVSVQKPEGAKFAITHYRLLDQTEDYSLLEVQLETGRKNQIRVHLAELGCPVVGDRRYGADAQFIRRIRLHACYLSILHPKTGKTKEFFSKMPKEFLVLKPENEKYKRF